MDESLFRIVWQTTGRRMHQTIEAKEIMEVGQTCWSPLAESGVYFIELNDFVGYVQSKYRLLEYEPTIYPIYGPYRLFNQQRPS